MARSAMTWAGGGTAAASKGDGGGCAADDLCATERVGAAVASFREERGTVALTRGTAVEKSGCGGARLWPGSATCTRGEAA
jgi:hypothetical protein